MNAEQKARVLSAVKEVIDHSRGGLVEIFVYPTEIPGNRRIKVRPHLNGRNTQDFEVRLDDDN